MSNSEKTEKSLVSLTIAHHHSHASSPSETDRLSQQHETAEIAVQEKFVDHNLEESVLSSDVDERQFATRTTRLKVLLGVAVVTFLVFFTGDSVTIKSMDRQHLPPCKECTPRYFESPFFQTWLMYLGETLCLWFYFGKKLWKSKMGTADRSNNNKINQRPSCPIHWWILDAVFDYSSICLETVAVNYARASTVTMLRNFNVAMTAAFTLLYLRYGLRINHISGVILLTTGLCIVGIDAMKDPDGDTNYDKNQWIGIIMAVVGTTIAAFQFVWEEYLFRKYNTPPVLGLGLIGVFGGLLATAMLGIAWATGLEDFSGSLFQMGTNNTAGNYLKAASTFYCFIPVVELLAGMYVTKLGSGLLRTIIQGTATVALWVTELCVGWSSFRTLSFAGLICIVVACILYNYDQYEWVAKSEPTWSKEFTKPILCGCLKNPDQVAPKEGVAEVGYTSE